MTIPTQEQMKALAAAVEHIYQQIGSDLNLDNDSDIALVEICLDSDRLTEFGYPELESIWHNWFMQNNVDLDDCYRKIANVAWG